MSLRRAIRCRTSRIFEHHFVRSVSRSLARRVCSSAARSHAGESGATPSKPDDEPSRSQRPVAEASASRTRDHQGQRKVIAGSDRAELLTIWGVLSQRRASFHNALWQTPALSTTAQSFLLTISLADGTAPGARIMVAFVSIVVAVVTAQIIIRHRLMELLDWIEIARLEERLEFYDLMDQALPHGDHPPRVARPMWNRYHPDTVTLAEERWGLIGWHPLRWLSEKLALHAWLLVQAAFLLVSVLIIVASILGWAIIVGGTTP